MAVGEPDEEPVRDAEPDAPLPVLLAPVGAEPEPLYEPDTLEGVGADETVGRPANSWSDW